MAKPKTKLPKVWVVFDSKGGVCDVATSPRTVKSDSEILHPYAPIQPPRRCVWTESRFGYLTSCGDEFGMLREPKFCENCGGRITRRSPR